MYALLLPLKNPISRMSRALCLWMSSRMTRARASFM